MGARVWTCEKVAEGLIDLQNEGYKLRVSNILKHAPGLYHAIYFKYKTGPSNFRSLYDARKYAAELLIKRGDLEGAARMLTLNEPPPNPNAFSEKEKNSRKADLIEELRKKIEKREDVSLRNQREVDRSFTGKAERAFGRYEIMFDSAKLNYWDYSKVKRRKPATKYLDDLTNYVRKGIIVDKQAMEKIDPQLVKTLDWLPFGGYYAAMEKVKARLLEEGYKPASEIKVDELRGGVRQRKREEAIEKREKKRNRIFNLNADSTYTGEIFPFADFEGTLNGKDVERRLRSSGKWMTNKEISIAVKVSTSGITHFFPERYPDEVIKYNIGKNYRYLYSSSIVGKHKRKVKDTSPLNSLNRIARELGVGYRKVLDLSKKLGLGNLKEGVFEIGREEVEILNAVLKREEEIHRGIIAKIQPDREYLLVELEKMGIPIAHFDKGIREGKILQVGKDVRRVSGKYALQYFEKDYDSSHLSQGLRLISFFNPGLYTSTDLVEKLQLDRGTIRRRVLRLLSENPESCFKIRKSGRMSRVLVTEDLVSMLENWDHRGNLSLMNVLSKVKDFPSKREVIRAIKDLEDLVDEEGMGRENNLAVFGLLKTIRDFQSKELPIGDVELKQKDVSMIISYMQFHSYKTLELKQPLSLEQLKTMIDSSLLLKKAEETKRTAEFALYSANEKLIHSVMRNLGQINPDNKRYSIMFQAGQEGLMYAIRRFTSERGAQLSSYAYPCIRGMILRANRKFPNDVSLHDSVGEDGMLIDFIDSNTQTSNENTESSELKEGLQKLVGSLGEREKEIIIARFGLNGEAPKTLEEVGQIFKLTRERIRQIQSGALQKLRKKAGKLNFESYLIN